MTLVRHKCLQRARINLEQCIVKFMLEDWHIKILEKVIGYITENERNEHLQGKKESNFEEEFQEK